MDDELAWASAATIRDLVGRREISPVKVVDACLARIDRLDPILHAFITIDREGAIAAARQAEADVRSGARLGPLHGVPVAVKDDLWVKGLPATAGSLLFARFHPSRDGTVVQRLRAAGAIIIGKTNMPEFAGWARSKSFLAGEAVNPWDIRRIPGASSGGSAAAVASGMVPLAIGTDGGGSVRIPSALCGIAGLFPTIGRVPDFGGFQCSPISSAGPMARTITDLALLQQVIAGPDRRIRSAITDPAPDILTGLDGGVSGLRIAWSPDFGRIPVDPLIVEAAQAALSALRDAGAEVEQIDDRISHPWGDGAFMAALREAAAACGETAMPAGDLPETGFPEEALIASTAASEGFFAMPEFRAFAARHDDLLSPPHRLFGNVDWASATMPSTEQLRGEVDRVFAAHDVLCSPTMAVVAPPIPAGWASPYADPFSGTNFTFIANATGRPAASIPCGLAHGLPVGFQIIGRPGDEATVLRVARAVERALPALPRPPEISRRG